MLLSSLRQRSSPAFFKQPRLPNLLRHEGPAYKSFSHMGPIQGPASESALKKQEALGFRVPDFSWAAYIRYRPTYPASFYNGIYEHHSKARASNTFTTALDVGAGPGVVSEVLASKFQHVVVADPNTSHVAIAQQRLAPHFPADKFTFLAEGGEKSSLQDGSVDCIVAGVSLHWCDVPVAMADFGRLLRSGGTLCVLHYNTPRIVGNDKANEAWHALCMDLTDEYLGNSGSYNRRVMRHVISGWDHLILDPEIWEAGTQRFYTNCGGDTENVKLLSRLDLDPFPSAPRAGDEKHFVEDDAGWVVEGADMEWFEGQFSSYVFDRTLEDDKERWAQLEAALGGRDKKVKVNFPSVRVLITRK